MKIETLLDHQTILANQARPVHFALRFEADDSTARRPQPAAFCVVLDRSGSMAGAPLERAREAALLAIRHLRPDDLFSLVVFDETTQSIIPLQSPARRGEWTALVNSIGPGGSTNLTAGWMLGRDELRKATQGATRRLLLLSDGQLNHGIVDPEAVSRIVGQGLEMDGLRTSSLGFGQDYNEALLAGLARATNGTFYDADSPEKLPAIFASELDGLQNVAVQNLRVRVQPLAFCHALEFLGQYPATLLPDGRTEYACGELISGESRVSCFALEVLPLPCINGTPVATLKGEPLLDVEVLYDELKENSIASRTSRHLIRIQATQNSADVTADSRVIEWVSLQKATKFMEELARHGSNLPLSQSAEVLKMGIEEVRALGSDADTAEAVEMMERLHRKMELEGGLSVSERKKVYYRSSHVSKMSSAGHWTQDEAKPGTKPKGPGKSGDKGAA